jgi:peptidase M15-like protein
MLRSRVHIAACLLAISCVSAAAAGASTNTLTVPHKQDAADEVSARRGAPSTSHACLPFAIKNALSTIESQFGPVQVISTHRPGARIAGTRHASLHSSCRAVDFHPPRGRYREVLAYLRNNWEGGIGTYSGQMHHLHIDVGYKKVWHTAVGRTQVATGDRPNGRRKVAHRHRATTGFQAPEIPPM